MGLQPGNLPDHSLRMVVRQRSSTYSLDRLNDDTTASAETKPDYTQNATTADVAFGLPSETVTVFSTGEVVGRSIVGLALPSADVQHDDRFDYQGRQYEVDTIVGVPTDADPDVLQLQCAPVNV